MPSAHAAPSQGLAYALATTLASTPVRKALSAVSTVVNGLSRMRMLMALDARNTTKNRIIATGVMIRLESQWASIAAKPSELNDEPVESARCISETAIGTNAPVATRPLTLCSTVSMTSSGFLMAVGSAVPAVSLMKHTTTTSNAGTQNHGFANHGSRAFSPSVLAW